MRFSFSVHLAYPDPAFPFKVELLWTRDCGLISLYFRPKSADHIAAPTDAVIGGLHFDRKNPDVMYIIPITPPPKNADTHPKAYKSKHPMRQFAKWAFRKAQRPYIDGEVLDLFPTALTSFIMHRQEREVASVDPLKYMAENAIGYTTVYLTTQADTCMERVKMDGQYYYIFGMTQVFPWAVDMFIDGHANGLATDATFEMMDPYALEILNVIVRNEGMPIGQAIFPTETKKSYERLDDHVKEVLSFYGCDPKSLENMRAVTDQGTGFAALVKSLHLLQALCHAHLRRNAGTNGQEGDAVSQLLFTSSEKGVPGGGIAHQGGHRPALSQRRQGVSRSEEASPPQENAGGHRTRVQR
jgi:hypothetical protein